MSEQRSERKRDEMHRAIYNVNALNAIECDT